EAVLLHAGEVGMARAGRGERLLGLAGRRRHLLLPLRPLGVQDLDGNRRAERAAVAYATEDRELVLLEPHARTSTEPEAAPTQLGLDLLDGDGQARGQALDHDDEAAAMRLASSEEPE